MLDYIYQSLATLSWPMLRALPYIRTLKGKEVGSRIGERFGISTTPRPKDKKIIWIHAASNGEALSALSIIDYFNTLDNPPHILMTTMTITGAQLLRQRVTCDNFTHQFIPYDHPSWVGKFHDFWQPDMVVWIESELWPNHLKDIKRRQIPAILLNARLSDKSVKRWKMAPSFFKNMMDVFDVVFAQTDRDKNNLTSLGINDVKCEGNLKDYAPALPYEIIMADDMRGAIVSRPTILFASTHDPEEKIALDVICGLKKDFPDLLSIIVPRHPKRGNEITHLANQTGLSVAQRSLKMSPRLNTDIYIADTLGELGLFYHLCPIVFVGNSLGTKPGGGHNLMEPAWHDCAIISGHDLHNFSIQEDEMPAQHACEIVNNADELYQILFTLIKDTEKQQTLAKNAYDYVVKKQNSGLTPIMDAIKQPCQKAGIL